MGEFVHDRRKLRAERAQGLKEKLGAETQALGEYERAFCLSAGKPGMFWKSLFRPTRIFFCQ
jgi:hypothetical protein